MKFHCPKCRKQFLLSSRLAGKSLRVRCTSCGSVFRMRIAGPDPALAAHAHAAPEEATEEQPSVAAAPDETSADAAAAEPAAAPAGDPAAAAPALAAPALAAPATHAPAPVPAPRDAPPPPARPLPQTPEPTPAQHRYFAVISGKRLGPMPFAALRRLVVEQKIARQTPVWRKGLPEWIPAEKMDDIAGFFPAVAAPPPTPPLPSAPPPLPPPLPPDFRVQPPQPEGAPPLFTAIPADEVLQPRRARGGDLFTVHERTERTDQETTDQEVRIEEVDNQFFALGSMAPAPSPRGADQIQIAEEPFFPQEIDDRAPDKGARASLRDFSVMVRLSNRSRAKNAAALVALASITALAITLIFTFGDPLGAIFPEKKIEETKRHGPSGFVTEVDRSKKKEDKEDGKTADRNRKRQDEGDAPASLLKAMQEKEWRVSVGEETLEVDRSLIASKLKERQKSSDRSAKKPGQHVSREEPVGDPEEMSLEDFVLAAEKKKNTPDKLLTAKSGQTGPEKEKSTVGGKDSAMGALFGGPKRLEEEKVGATVKERESDGTALKAIVARHAARKVGGERKSFQRCMDSFGSSYTGGGKLSATLHFSEQGTVDRVSVAGGGHDLEDCFGKIFQGWRVATVNRKVKVPISIRFE